MRLSWLSLQIRLASKFIKIEKLLVLANATSPPQVGSAFVVCWSFGLRGSFPPGFTCFVGLDLLLGVWSTPKGNADEAKHFWDQPCMSLDSCEALKFDKHLWILRISMCCILVCWEDIYIPTRNEATQVTCTFLEKFKSQMPGSVKNKTRCFCSVPAINMKRKWIRCLNFLDENWWFLSFSVFGLLSSYSLLYSQRFGRYVLRPSSAVCRTR